MFETESVYLLNEYKLDPYKYYSVIDSESFKLGSLR